MGFDAEERPTRVLCVMKNANRPRAASPQAPSGAARTAGRQAGRPWGSSPKGVVPLGLRALGREKWPGHMLRRRPCTGSALGGRPWGLTGAGQLGGAPPGTPCDSVALGRGHETESELFISHTKQMLHDQPPRVSVPSRKLLQDGCGAHAFTYPGRGGLQAHEGWVVLKTGHLCYIRH